MLFFFTFRCAWCCLFCLPTAVIHTFLSENGIELSSHAVEMFLFCISDLCCECTLFVSCFKYVPQLKGVCSLYFFCFVHSCVPRQGFLFVLSSLRCLLTVAQTGHSDLIFYSCPILLMSSPSLAPLIAAYLPGNSHQFFAF